MGYLNICVPLLGMGVLDGFSLDFGQYDANIYKIKPCILYLGVTGEHEFFKRVYKGLLLW